MNIYSDKAFLPEDIPHAPLLYPLWGFQSPYGDSTLGRRSYEHYLEKGTELFQLTSLSEARFAALPFHWEHVVDYVMRRTAKGLGADTATPELALKRAEEFAALAAGEGRPVVVFFSRDSVEEVPLGNSVVFRTSLSGSSRHRNEYAMPFWMPDEVEALFGGELPLREPRPLGRVALPLRLLQKSTTLLRVNASTVGRRIDTQPDDGRRDIVWSANP